MCLDQYHIQKTIVTKNGKVFIAQGPQGKVVIKQAPVDSLLGEVELLAELQCKGCPIPVMYDTQICGPDLLIFMEYLTELDRASDLVKTGRALAQALDYLHRQHVYHLDVKPDNIGIDRKGNIKLFDFDLSCKINVKDGKDACQGKGNRGTRGFHPRTLYPEMKELANYDFYGWWMTLYWLYTGEYIDTPQELKQALKWLNNRVAFAKGPEKQLLQVMIEGITTYPNDVLTFPELIKRLAPPTTKKPATQRRTTKPSAKKAVAKPAAKKAVAKPAAKKAVAKPAAKKAVAKPAATTRVTRSMRQKSLG